MRRGSILVTVLIVGAAVFATSFPAQAGTCFHVRAKCKVCWNTKKAESIHPHTSSGQYLEGYCFKSGCGLGFHVAEAFAHASQHTNGNFHFKTWSWDAGFSSASAHASHGHCSLPTSIQNQLLCAREIVPPAEADTEGAFGITELETSDVRDGVHIRFLPESRLQVDARGLVRSTDTSLSSIRVAIHDALSDSSLGSGRIQLSISGENGSPVLAQDGIFAKADLQVREHPRIPGLHMVSLTDAHARIDGVIAEDVLIDVDLNAHHDGSEQEGGTVGECVDE